MADASPQTHMSEIAEADESARNLRYQRAWQAYDGEGPLPFEDEEGQADDNVRLDYPRLIVDKGVSFLAGKGGVEFQLDPITEEAEESDEKPEVDAPAFSDEDPEEDDDADPEEPEEPEVDEAALRAEAARAELDSAWPEEERHTDFHKLATNGGVCGHFWVRLFEDGRVAVLDPSTVEVVWDEDDFEIVLAYHITWNTVDPVTGEGKLRRKRIEPDDPEEPRSWTITIEEYNEEAGEWEPIEPESTDDDEDAEEAETVWPKPYPPVLGGQNLPAPNTFYGEPDLTSAVLDIIEQLQSVASDMRRIIRLHGHPVPVVTGEEAQNLRVLDVSIGELLAIPNKEAKLTQLQIAEITSALALYKELKTALFEAVRIPRVALGDRDKSGASTGVALQIEYEPLLEKTATKRLTYGAVLRQIAECVLDLRGFPGWRVTLGWPALLPSDEKTEAETAEADLRMKIVSRQTIAERRGYDWSVEAQRLAEEKEAGAEALAAAFDRGEVDDEE